MAPFRWNTLSLLRFCRKTHPYRVFIWRKRSEKLQKGCVQAKQFAYSVGMLAFVEFIQLRKRDWLCVREMKSTRQRHRANTNTFFQMRNFKETVITALQKLKNRKTRGGDVQLINRRKYLFFKILCCSFLLLYTRSFSLKLFT